MRELQHQVAPAAPADTLKIFGREWREARPDEPPPSLIPPDIQAELDRLIRENRSLRAAMRALLGDE